MPADSTDYPGAVDSFTPVVLGASRGAEEPNRINKLSSAVVAVQTKLNATLGAALGLTGATLATRFVGAVATVAPTTGTFAIGDFVIGRNGTLWICTVAGTPGTWVGVSGGGGGSGDMLGANNLSDVASAATSRTNLGLGTAATQATGAFDAAGAASTAQSAAITAAKGLPLGLTGAVAATRFVGGTASVAPTTGTFAVGDFVTTATGYIYVCTTAGTPGTWAKLLGAADAVDLTGVVAFLNDVTIAGSLTVAGASVRRVVSATYAATVTPNCATTDLLKIAALTGNLAVAPPSGTPVDGQQLEYRMLQDATGSRTVTFSTSTNGFVFGTDVTAALIPTAANAKWRVMTEWDATDAKWWVTAIVRGF